jgi:hypothetical protein
VNWLILVTERVHMPADIWTLRNEKYPRMISGRPIRYDSEIVAEHHRSLLAHKFRDLQFTVAPASDRMPIVLPHT